MLTVQSIVFDSNENEGLNNGPGHSQFYAPLTQGPVPLTTTLLGGAALKGEAQSPPRTPGGTAGSPATYGASSSPVAPGQLFSPSSIHRLPFEILGLVFLHYVQTDSPWTLTRVSRLWRTVTMGTPCLWAGVRIAGMRRQGKVPRWSGGLEYCDSVKRLTGALQRAGAVPLDVCIGTHDFHHVYVTQEENEADEREREALLELSSTMGVNNWRSLEIARCWVLHFTNLDGLLHGMFAHLQELSVCGFQSSTFLHLLVDAPRLRSITLRHVSLRPYALLPLWPKIRSLCLVKAFLFDDDEYDAFATILESSQSLETLQIELKDIHRPQWTPLHPRGPISLPELRCLDYHGHWAIPLIAPNLVQISIEDIRLPELLQTKHPDGHPVVIEAPQLSHLVLVRTILPDLAILQAPRLRDLTLRSMMKPNTDEGFAAVWPSRSNPLHEDDNHDHDDATTPLFPSLSILRLEDLTASFTALRSALETLSAQLYQLHFKNCLLPRTFFRAFCSGSPTRPPSPSSLSRSSSPSSRIPSASSQPCLARCLCPNLEAMSIVVHEKARGDKAVIQPALQDVVHMRKLAGLKLGSLIVDWNEAGDREEMCRADEDE